MHIDKIQFTPVTEALPEVDTTWKGHRKFCLVVVSEDDKLKVGAAIYAINRYAKTEKGRAPRWGEFDSGRLFYRPERIIAWAPWPSLGEELPDLNSDSPLARLQSFVEGFEDDEAQENMQELLHILPQAQQVMNTALMALVGYLPGHRNAITDKAIDDLRQILGYGGENKTEYRTPCCNAAVDEGEWCSDCGANLTTGTTLPPAESARDDAVLRRQVSALALGAEQAMEQRDAALAEIAELEKKLAMTSDAASKGDAARHAAGGMEMEIQELKAKLADAQAGRQAGRREQSAYELLRQALKLMPLGTKKRAEWVGRTSDLLCIAQAQHSVPEISGIGRDAEHPRAVVLYLRNEPSDEDMRAIQNFLRAMLAAAPGKEDNA